jgi:hypothetical protein
MLGARRTVAGALLLVLLASALLVPSAFPVEAHSPSTLIALWSFSRCLPVQFQTPARFASDVVSRCMLSQDGACQSTTSMRTSAPARRPNPFASVAPFRPLQDLALGLYVHHVSCGAGRSCETTKRAQRASGKAENPASPITSDSQCWATLRVQDSACWLAALPVELRTQTSRIADSRPDSRTVREAVDVVLPPKIHDRTLNTIRDFEPVVRAWSSEARSGHLYAIVDSRGCHACPLVRKAGLVVLKAQGDPRSGLRLLLWCPTTQALRGYLAALRANGCAGEVIGRCEPPAGHGTTARQQEALSVALESGYFDEPKRASLAELAVRLGVSKTAMGRLLRRAVRGGLQAP